MKKILIIASVLVMGLAMALHAQTVLTPDNVPRMGIEELKQQMDNPNLTIIDVRKPGDWADATTKIKGSIREDPPTVTTWMAKYPIDRTLVFYCA